MKKYLKKILLSKILLRINYYIYYYLKKCYFIQKERLIRDKYDIAENFKFNGENINFYGDGILKIDEDSYIGNGGQIQLTQGTQVKIGKKTSISHNVRIYTSNRNPEDIISNKEIIGSKVGDVEIGNNCWIGANVFICQGIKIGNNCVIGANSVVSKDIPNNSIAAGAPIKIIKSAK